MNDILNPLIKALQTYSGAVLWIFTFTTVMSASATQVVRDVERKRRSRRRYEKPDWWNHALRAVSILGGVAAAPFARILLLEIPRVPTGEEAVPLELVVPSHFVSIFIGFMTGAFLTFSIAFLKWAVSKWNPEIAEALPDFSETTELDLEEIKAEERRRGGDDEREA